MRSATLFCKEMQLTKRMNVYYSFKNEALARSRKRLSHNVCVSEKFALKIQLSGGNRHDVPEDRKLIESLSRKPGYYLLMDRAYEDNETQALAIMRGLISIVPPKKTEKHLGNMTQNFTNVATKLSVFSFALSAFAKFLPAMTNLKFSIFQL